MNWENFLMIFSTSVSVENSLLSAYICLWLSFDVCRLLWASMWSWYLSRSEGYQHLTLHTLPRHLSYSMDPWTYRTVRDPSDTLVAFSLGQDFNRVSDDETWIESNSKLSNNWLSSLACTVLRLLLLDLFQELLRSRACNCTQVLNYLLSWHADTTIEQDDGPLLCVCDDVDCKVIVSLTLTTHLSEPLLLKSVWAVRQ